MKLTAGLLSTNPRGKLGNMVGGSWKGIGYVREYVIPANPQTVNQQVNRSLFGSISTALKPMTTRTARPYVDRIVTRQSGFSRLMQLSEQQFRQNEEQLDCNCSAHWLVITDGPCEDALSVTYDVTDPDEVIVNAVIPEDPLGNPQGIGAAIYTQDPTLPEIQPPNFITWGEVDADEFGQAELTLSTPGLDVANAYLHFYTWCSDPTVTTLICDPLTAQPVEQPARASGTDFRVPLEPATGGAPLTSKDRENREIILSLAGSEPPFVIRSPELLNTSLNVDGTAEVEPGQYGFPPYQVGIQWQTSPDGLPASFVDIAGANELTYTAVPADEDQFIRARVAVDGAGGGVVTDTGSLQVGPAPE